MRKYICSICGYTYDEAAGISGSGISAGTKWEDLPESFVCPVCKAQKSKFKLIEEASAAVPPANSEVAHVEDIKELSAGEISAIFSSLATGIGLMRRADEAEAFKKISDYYKTKMTAEEGKSPADVKVILDEDLSSNYANATAAAKANSDRGALRTLVWTEKASIMMSSLLERYEAEGDSMLEGTNVYYCDICGFIHIGDLPPDICPVCKVPKFKILQVERR